MKTFILTSLATIGFAEDSQLSLDKEVQTPDADAIIFNNILNRQLPFTLAGHSSHRSHSSHGSHRSSSSSTRTYSSPTPTIPSQPKTNRNSNSTPPSSVLPSSPSIAPKTLRGNTTKFSRLVTRVQMLLYAYGYYTGEIVGVMTTETQTALTKYQSVNGLKITGRLDDATLKSMNVSLD